MLERRVCVELPMPLGSFGSTRVVALLAEDALGVCSPGAVEVEEERLNVFARGARCVSLSSTREVRNDGGRSEDSRTLCKFPGHVYGCATVGGERRSGDGEMEGRESGKGRRRERGRQSREGKAGSEAM